jgi:surfactin synthase thioesterase subunit
MSNIFSVKSEDDRQVVEDWDHFIQDSTALIHETMLLPKYKNVPYFLFGHSMGGIMSFFFYSVMSDILLCSYIRCNFYYNISQYY